MSESAEDKISTIVQRWKEPISSGYSVQPLIDELQHAVRAAESAARAEGMSEGIDRAFKVLAGACDNHTGENCVPFDEFMERYGNCCYFCSIDELSAANIKTYADGLREGQERMRERAAHLVEPGEPLDSGPGAYDEEPPTWAQDPFNENDAYKCGYCDSWMTVVRPGKVQCDTCGDGSEGEWIMRTTFAREIRALEVEDG